MKFLTLIFISGFLNTSQVKSYKVSYISEKKINLMGNISTLTSSLNVYATENSTVIRYDNVTTDSKNILDLNLPDSLIFDKSTWYNMTEGVRTVIPFDSVTITATEEYKVIFSLNCQKYILTNGNSEYECWVCKDLPNTIIPFPAAKGFEGAVLECKEKNSALVIKMKSIYFNNN